MTRALLVLLLALPAAARPRLPRPEAKDLILRALTGPATSWTAVERVQVFRPDAKPKALTATLEGSADGRVRRELRPKKKGAAPVVLLDAQAPPAAEDLAVLARLYDLSVSTGGVVAKRKTWRVELRLKSGLLRRTIWVDRDSGFLMKRETYRDDGSLARRERLTKLSLGVSTGGAFPPAVPGPWAPPGFVPAGTKDGARLWSDGVETYSVSDKGVVTGLLAEDDAERARASAGGRR